MQPLRYQWTDEHGAHDVVLARVPGTGQHPFDFGAPAHDTRVIVPEFYIGTVPVTQAFWRHVVGAECASLHRGNALPVENISWDALLAPDGFLQQVNASDVAVSLREQCGQSCSLRLPTEAEWEYAARGGPHWRDGHAYSGSDDIDAVAWYDRGHGDWTQPVAMKAPNQLGLHDMSGNVWEWCRDRYTRDLAAIPRDGSAYRGPGDERVLRGGCIHNWAMHCTVTKRYAIASDYHDGCIGFRLVMATGSG